MGRSGFRARLPICGYWKGHFTAVHEPAPPFWVRQFRTAPEFGLTFILQSGRSFQRRSGCLESSSSREVSVPYSCNFVFPRSQAPAWERPFREAPASPLRPQFHPLGNALRAPCRPPGSPRSPPVTAPSTCEAPFHYPRVCKSGEGVRTEPRTLSS